MLGIILIMLVPMRILRLNYFHVLGFIMIVQTFRCHFAHQCELLTPLVRQLLPLAIDTATRPNGILARAIGRLGQLSKILVIKLGNCSVWEAR